MHPYSRASIASALNSRTLSLHGALGRSKSSRENLLMHAHAALLRWLVKRNTLTFYKSAGTFYYVYNIAISWTKNILLYRMYTTTRRTESVYVELLNNTMYHVCSLVGWLCSRTMLFGLLTNKLKRYVLPVCTGSVFLHMYCFSQLAAQQLNTIIVLY